MSVQSDYTAGKQAFLDGKRLDSHGATSNDAARHNFRMGWRAARSNVECHPDWSDAFILSDVG